MTHEAQTLDLISYLRNHGGRLYRVNGLEARLRFPDFCPPVRNGTNNSECLWIVDGNPPRMLSKQIVDSMLYSDILQIMECRLGLPEILELVPSLALLPSCDGNNRSKKKVTK